MALFTVQVLVDDQTLACMRTAAGPGAERFTDQGIVQAFAAAGVHPLPTRFADTAHYARGYLGIGKTSRPRALAPASQ